MVELFGHPFSSYTWKAEIALQEKGADYALRMLGPDHPENMGRLKTLSPLGKFPVLVDGDQVIFETSIIVEHVDRTHPVPPHLIPEAHALEVRMLDRVFDNYVMDPMQRVVGDYLRPEADRHPPTVAEAETAFDRIYDWLEARMAGRTWAVGDTFTLADCAAAPALFYADWIRPIGNDRLALTAYRARLLARPSVARCVEAARPWRPHFPPGAPDRD